MSKPKAVTKSRTLADFRAAYDKDVIVPNKIRAGLIALENELGSEAWELEGEFIKRASVSQSDIGRYREGFVKHIVETTGKSPKRIWFSQVKVAARVRGE